MTHSPHEIIVTAEAVESLRSARGGFTDKAVRFITGDNSFTWAKGSQKKGWLHRHLGESRSRRVYIELLECESEREATPRFGISRTTARRPLRGVSKKKKAETRPANSGSAITPTSLFPLPVQQRHHG